MQVFFRIHWAVGRALTCSTSTSAAAAFPPPRPADDSAGGIPGGGGSHSVCAAASHCTPRPLRQATPRRREKLAGSCGCGWRQEGWHFSCERETIMERQVPFQSSD